MSLPSELSNDVKEGLLDVDAVFGGCLDEVAAKFLCECLSLLGGDFAFGDTVAFVSDQHHRGLAEHGCGCADGRAGVGGRTSHGSFFDALNLAVEALDPSKRRARGYAVHEDKTFAVTYPLIAQSNVLFLAGRVEYLEHARLAINLYLLTVRILDGGVISLNKVIQAELGWSEHMIILGALAQRV